MAVDQLPGRVREFVNYLNSLLARLDQNGGWCAVFWQRDPDGMRACLEGREVPPWDVVESVLQDLAAEYGPDAASHEKERARGLHAAALAVYDARPGGRDALGDRLDVMLREQRYAAERQAELGHLLASAITRQEADAYRLDLAWARDDHERATARCAELRSRMAELDRHEAGAQAAAIRRGRRGDGAVFRIDREYARDEAPSTGTRPAGRATQDSGFARQRGPYAPEPPTPQTGPHGPGARGPSRDDAPYGTGARGASRDDGPYESGVGGASRDGASYDFGVGGASQDVAPYEAGFRGASGDGGPYGSEAAGVSRDDGPYESGVGGASRDGASYDIGVGGASQDGAGYGTGASSHHAPFEAASPSAVSGADTYDAGFPNAPRQRDARAAGPGPGWASQPAGPVQQTPEPSAPAPKQRKRRRGSARFAGMADEDAAPVVAAPAAAPALPGPEAAGRTPRGARFAGAAEVAEPAQEPKVEPLDAAGAREVAGAVEGLVRLRNEGRSGEAHALLVEATYWPAARFPLLAAELQRAGLGADWATLLGEAASLPADRLVAAADALVAAGRGPDGEQILRQGVARPAAEIGEAVLGLVAEGRRREVHALLDAYVRVRTPEEAARSAEPDPQALVPLLLEAAQGVSDERHWDLVHALRVAGFAP